MKFHSHHLSLIEKDQKFQFFCNFKNKSDGEESADEKEAVPDDEVFENVEEMEVTLCQLINEHFRMDDEDLFMGLYD